MFATTPDQELLERTTERFLDARFPAARLRELADAERTFDPAAWREGAELGWTSLLVPEAVGGGSVSGNGLADLLVVCSLFGRHAAPGPLFGTNLVAAALGRWGSADQREGPLAELLSGAAVAARAHGTARGADGVARSIVTASPSTRGVVLAGGAGAVEGAEAASHLLVTAEGPEGRTLHLVPLDAGGIELRPLRGVDLTRRYHEVLLRDVAVPAASVVGEAGAADSHDEELLDLVATMAAAEMVGAADRALAATLEWTVDRYSFGRPLGSYQAIKHRIADARTQLEACEAVTARAGEAVGGGAPDGPDWASAAMAHTASRSPEIVQECVQFHGGIGVTYELDLHLHLRRVVVDSKLHGSAADHWRRLGRRVVDGREAAA